MSATSELINVELCKVIPSLEIVPEPPVPCSVMTAASEPVPVEVIVEF